jgi:hypothetical protein
LFSDGPAAAMGFGGALWLIIAYFCPVVLSWLPQRLSQWRENKGGDRGEPMANNSMPAGGRSIQLSAEATASI